MNNYDKIEFGICHMRVKKQGVHRRVDYFWLVGKGEGQRILHSIGGI